MRPPHPCWTSVVRLVMTSNQPGGRMYRWLCLQGSPLLLGTHPTASPADDLQRVVDTQIAKTLTSTGRRPRGPTAQPPRRRHFHHPALRSGRGSGGRSLRRPPGFGRWSWPVSPARPHCPTGLSGGRWRLCGAGMRRRAGSRGWVRASRPSRVRSTGGSAFPGAPCPSPRPRAVGPLGCRWRW